MMNKLKQRFKGLADILNYIKSATDSAVARLFTARRANYDDLLKRMGDFERTITSSDASDIDMVQLITASDDGVVAIKVGGGDAIPKADGKISGKHIETVRFGDGTALPVMDFNMPNRQELSRDVAMLDEAEEYLEELRGMVHRLETSKMPGSRKMLAANKEYIKKLNTQAESLLSALEGLTDKHMPPLLTKLAGRMSKYLTKTLPADVYSDLGYDIHITSNGSINKKAKREPVEFSYYLYIDDLDKDLFQIDEYILVLTGVVNEVREKGSRKSKFNMTVYITAMNKFKRPGMFDVGTRLAGNNLSGMETNLYREINKLMSLHGMGPVFNKRKVGVTQQALRHSGLMKLDGVIDVDVVDNDVIIEITNMKEAVVKTELWPEVLIQLRKAVRAPKKSNFVYTLEKDGKKRTMRIVNVNNPV